MKNILEFKYIYLFVLFLGFSNSIPAQENSNKDSEKVFRFIYIAHDGESMSDDLLLQGLSVIKRNIDEGQFDPSIFYLSNGISYEESDKILRKQGQGDLNYMDTTVIRIGTPIVIGMDILGNNQDDYEKKLLGGIQNTISHDVNTDVDLENILHILRDADFLDENDNIKYGKVSFEFFIHPRFWEQRLHEKLIAALYFVLDAQKYDIRFNIHHMISDVSNRPSYWKSQKANFGPWNISDINNAYTKVQLMQ